MRPGSRLQAGSSTIQGTPYAATDNNADGAFYLQGFFDNPYNICRCAGNGLLGHDRAEQCRLPSPAGRLASRITYAALFSPCVGDHLWRAGCASTTYRPAPDKDLGGFPAMGEPAGSSRIGTIS